MRERLGIWLREMAGPETGTWNVSEGVMVVEVQGSNDSGDPS